MILSFHLMRCRSYNFCMTTHLHLSTPADFSFAATINSHGWRDLTPFQYDPAAQTLTRVHAIGDKKAALTITAADSVLNVVVSGIEALTDTHQHELIQTVRRMFCLDWQVQNFYDFLRDYPGYEWVEQQQHGRMLVAPTVWEELVKTLFTTNTTWAQTKGMCARLCPPGAVFPTAEQIAAESLDSLSARLRAGYRTAYLHTLAEQVASGKLDVESWYNGGMTSAEVYQAVRSIKGFGDYAAGTLLRLLGYFDRLAIDTVARAAFKRITGGEAAADKAIQAYYAQFGDWRGLALWMDCIRSDAMVDSMLHHPGKNMSK